MIIINDFEIQRKSFSSFLYFSFQIKTRLTPILQYSTLQLTTRFLKICNWLEHFTDEEAGLEKLNDLMITDIETAKVGNNYCWLNI